MLMSRLLFLMIIFAAISIATPVFADIYCRCDADISSR